MTDSSMRGAFLSVLVFVIGFTIIPGIYAEMINTKSIALEETMIIEFTNNGNEDVNSFRIWLGSDSTFKSFKTEKGWEGARTPQGVIVFTSSESVKPGDSVKFGVKTDKIVSGINWKALDKDDKQIDIGKTIADQAPKAGLSPNPDRTASGIYPDSVFRIIPEKPHVGSSIRVTGDNFGASQEFDFFIDSKKIGSFVTDDSGHFMTTMKIPRTMSPDRVDFMVRDGDGEEKKISLRINQEKSRIPTEANIKLTIKGIPKVVHRSDMLDISGTGNPGGAVTAKISNPAGDVINTRTAEIDSKGNWKLEEEVLIPLDTPFGKYNAEISDGREKISINWTVESSNVIIIEPEKLKFEPGDVMKYSGTALPNMTIELILEDPLGNERYTDIIDVSDSGLVDLEYPTIANVDKEGTWTLIATQGKHKEFVFAGLGELPTIPVNFEFDKLNYKSSEVATISLIGEPGDVLNMLIIDPSDKPKGESIQIKLKPDGRNNYELDLKGYSSGVYTAVVSKGATKSTEIFTVGLQVGSGDIEINTTKLDYEPGDSILILGETGPNVLLTIALSNPQGKEVKVKETFSDKNGRISEDGFRIPTGGEPGKWQLKASSGSNLDTVDIEVTAVQQEGMVINVSDGGKIVGLGETIIIKVAGARGTVEIVMIADDGEVIGKTEFPATTQGEINQTWSIPKDTVPGTYTIKASDAVDSAETTYVLK